MRFRLFFGVVCAMVAGSSHVQAESPHAPPSEYQVKAAYLRGFVPFVEWPPGTFASDHSSITLCILGTDPFGAALTPVTDKGGTGRKIQIKRCSKLDELERCHILFVSGSESEHVAEVLGKVRDWNTLTVSDIEGFADRDGIINFVTVGNRIRFQINIRAADRAGLKISSRLLNLATVVLDAP